LKQSLDTPAIQILGEQRDASGFIHGMRYPSLILLLTVHVHKKKLWREQADNVLADLLESRLGEKALPETACDKTDQEQVVHSLLFWMDRLYKAAGLNVFEQGKIIGFQPEASAVMIAVPTLMSMHKITGRAFMWLVTVFNASNAGNFNHTCLNDLPFIIKHLEQKPAAFSNTRHFLKVSFNLGIPYTLVAGELYQFGYGSRARLLESSFTDQTSVIGTRLARNKTMTATVLRRVGIPVPDHWTVNDMPDAEKAANELGFPVVVKPADLDGGAGVAAGLTTIDEVRKAFVAARKKSGFIIVEKHFFGRDYRLTVLQGKLIYAVERIPGGVTGDGTSSIKMLVDRLNENPDRGEGSRAVYKRLVLDDEAASMLAKAGMDMGSIPDKDTFIPLRSAANIACGGTLVPVPDKVHPDNSLLAVRAVSALRLDLAGVDLLIPDISRSWKESGAAICEINAQPNLGGIDSSDLLAQFFHRIVEGNGRIPIAVVIGASPDWQIAEAIRDKLSDSGFVTGWTDHGGVTVGDTTITGSGVDAYTSGCILVGEQNVDAVVLCVHDTGMLSTGLPFERFDLMVIAGSHINLPEGQGNHAVNEFHLNTMLDFILPCCDGSVIVVDDNGLESLEILESLPEGLMKINVAKNQAVDVISEAMIDFDRKHRIGLIGKNSCGS
jgi:cyanophycin synthetase